MSTDKLVRDHDETPLSYQEVLPASDQDGSRPPKGDDDRDNRALTGNDRPSLSPPSIADDNEKVLLSLLLGPDAESPTLVLLLRIPHEVIELYCLKPRKWLHYVATIICGVQGKLRFIGRSEDITDQDMEHGVDGGDHFIFRLSGEASFMDVSLRFRGNDSRTVSSRSRVVPLGLRQIYGGCPFTKIQVGYCQACHIIPFNKGDEYLGRLLGFLHEPNEGITIDSHENMLMMDVRLHIGFDNVKNVAFLKTPNKFFKTNEVSGGEDADPEEYRVTVHCFSVDQNMRRDISHASHSDLKRGSGSRRKTPEPNEDVSHRPMDGLLDLAYVYNLLVQWGSTSAKEMLRKEEARYYPNGMTERGEYRLEKEEEEIHQHEQRNQERDESVDKNDREVDYYDFFFTMACMARGFTPEEYEAEQERRRREMEEREAERVDGWREGIDEQQAIECDEDTERQHSYLEDNDDEKPMSVQEALSRTPPQYITPVMPSMSSSSDTDSYDCVDLTASEFTIGDK